MLLKKYPNEIFPVKICTSAAVNVQNIKSIRTPETPKKILLLKPGIMKKFATTINVLKKLISNLFAFFTADNHNPLLPGEAFIFNITSNNTTTTTGGNNRLVTTSTKPILE